MIADWSWLIFLIICNTTWIYDRAGKECTRDFFSNYHVFKYWSRQVHFRLVSGLAEASFRAYYIKLVISKNLQKMCEIPEDRKKKRKDGMTVQNLGNSPRWMYVIQQMFQMSIKTADVTCVYSLSQKIRFVDSMNCLGNQTLSSL